MMRPVLAYHVILSAYGFWLPNDPRGSWSEFVRAWELLRFGDATKVSDKRSYARGPHDRKARREAKKYLTYDPVRFTGLQARAIARGFGRFVLRSGIIVHACAVMPDHAHLVILRHDYSIEEISRKLKGDATRQLSDEGMHPFAQVKYADRAHPSPWARHGWNCFIDSESYLVQAIDYVRRNPTREGMKAQNWSFVTPYLAD